MAKKRKSRGRSKGGKGRSEYVSCTNCGSRIPIDKAIKRTRTVSYVDPMLAKELKKSGAFIPRVTVTRYYCVSCAIHAGIIRVRPREERMVGT
ncbi:MAG: 30S ribosomal protein S26e [Thermoproteota archaeon]